MTYRRFHLYFNLPVLLLLSAAQTWDGWWDLYGVVMLGILAIVMVFTTPWDDFAVARGIWDYPSDRILFRIRHLPIEEYAFFVIQSMQVMLLGILMLRSIAERTIVPSQPGVMQWGLAAAVMVVWGAIGWRYRGIDRRRPAMHYAWHLLFWFGPVIILQWIIAGPILVAFWPAVVIPSIVIGTYLSAADLVAVRQGIWFFDRSQITGRYIAGVLPWEEVAFFYITIIVVAQSFVMLLPETSR
jgi:lycopene beta-cyclase